MIPFGTHILTARSNGPDQVMESFVPPLVSLFLRALNLVMAYSPLSIIVLVAIFIIYLWKVHVPYRLKWRIPVALFVAFALTLAAILWTVPTAKPYLAPTG